LSDSELSAVSKQWGAATTQFQRSEEAAALERTSGIITAAVGIGVAVMSLAAKAVVTAYSMNKFNAAKPDKELSDRLTDTNKLQDDAQIKLSKSRQELESVDTKIAQAKDRITHSKEKLQDKSLLAPEKKILEEKIKHDEADFKAAQVRRAELDKSITAQEKQYTEASKISDRVSEAIEGRTAKASREVQMFRAFLDMTDSLASTFQNISKIITATEFDYKAAQKKIESEMAAFMVNFFQSNLQNVKNSASQVSDGMNSVKSSCDASLQIFDDSVKLAVRS
jgi:chromosome segregation ATPase